MLRKPFFAAMIVALMVLCSGVAWGADTIDYELDTTTTVSEGIQYVNTNTVTFTFDPADYSAVSINGELLSKNDYDEFAKTLVLKQGKNSIKIEATVAGSETKLTETLVLYYLDTAVLGATIQFENPVVDKVELWDKSIIFKPVKASYIKGSDGKVLENQTISLEAKESTTFNATDKPYAIVTPSKVIYAFSNKDGSSLTEGVELTLPYDGAITSAAASTLAIMFSADNGTTWENLGGVADSKKYQIKTIINKLGYFTVVNSSKSFADMKDWSRQYVEPLWAKDIIREDGVDNTKIGLVTQIQRGEFTCMMIKGMGIQPFDTLQGYFTDITDGTPAAEADQYLIGNEAWGPVGHAESEYNMVYGYGTITPMLVEIAYRNGIIMGFDNDAGDSVFKYQDPLTREQAATILCRILNLKTEDQDTKVKKQLEKYYSDVDGASGIADWAEKYVLAVTKAKLMQGSAGAFKGGDNLSRAEACKLVYLVMQKLGKI
jgi:uncharacterized protein YdeI (BOF family)